MNTSAAASRPLAGCALDAHPHTQARRRAGLRQGTATLALASSLVISFLAASAAPTPLYDRYEKLWHATPLIGTIAFAVYALAVLAGLLWLASCPPCSAAGRSCWPRSAVRSSRSRCSRWRARSR